MRAAIRHENGWSIPKNKSAAPFTRSIIATPTLPALPFPNKTPGDFCRKRLLSRRSYDANVAVISGAGALERVMAQAAGRPR
jgi:hypothetical protein